MNTVCDARDDIATQVDELKSLTLATVTTDAVTQNLRRDPRTTSTTSLTRSRTSANDRRSEVEAATNEFTSTMKNGCQATSALRSRPRMRRHGSSPRLQQLEASYKKAFAPLDCN